MINENFVCFDCHISIRYPKHSDKKPTCPHCHKLCDHLGDRYPVPAKSKVKEWQALENDYRQLQQKIALRYLKWKKQLHSAILAHLSIAEQLQYPQIIKQDKMWLYACENLADLPKAYKQPFVNHWLKYADDKYVVTWSNIGKPNPQIDDLKKLPFNKERQKHLEKLWLDHNSLYIFDMFGELWFEHFNHPLQKHSLSELGKEDFFGRYRQSFPKTT